MNLNPDRYFEGKTRYLADWLNMLFGHPAWCRNWNRWRAELTNQVLEERRSTQLAASLDHTERRYGRIR